MEIMKKYTDKQKVIMVLPKEKKHLAEELLEQVRASDRLEFECEKAIDQMMEEAVPMSMENLPCGSYGAMRYHPGANAWRNGQLLVNHGEVYITKWTYQEDKSFWINTAWGVNTTKMLPSRLLIEM